MIPGAFDYHRPASVAAAIELLTGLDGEARVVAGGHSLIPMMKLRMALPDHLVDLRDIDGLSGIAERDGDLVIGAMTTQADLIASDLLAQKCPILRQASLVIADPQVRACGTLGGNVANGDPGNDMPALMLALDARFVLEGPNGSREVAARSFYEAAYETARRDDEILTEVRIPTPPAGHGHAYEKQKRKVGDYATAAAAVILTLDGGTCRSASIALTNVADTPLYAQAAGAALVGGAVGKQAIDAAATAAEAITEPASDGRGPAEFRTKLTGVMVRRAIAAALAHAQSNA